MTRWGKSGAVLCAFLGGCAGSSAAGSAAAGAAAGGADGSVEPPAAGSAEPPARVSTLRLPPTNAGLDYQLGGAYTPPANVAVVSRDREAAPAPGLYNICYVNGYQAQPEEQDWWQSEHPDLLLRDEQGELIIDPDWNEVLLDTSSDEKRQALAAVVGAWVQGCAHAGFDAVEIDNLDTYSRSGGRLSAADNVAFMKLLSELGHAAGLAVGQKNSTELLPNAAAMGTDFAVAEECNRYNECGDYQEVYGDLVFVIEYRDQDFAAGCKKFPELSIVRRDLNVSPAGSAKYVYDGC